MAEGGFGDGRVAQGGQLGEGQLRVRFPQLGGLLQLRGQLVQSAALPEDLDGPALLQGRVYGLVHVGGLAVDAAVHAVAQEFLCFCIHQRHGRDGGPDGGEQVLDGLALLEVGDVIGLAGGFFRGVAQL